MRQLPTSIWFLVLFATTLANPCLGFPVLSFQRTQQTENAALRESRTAKGDDLASEPPASSPSLLDSVSSVSRQRRNVLSWLGSALMTTTLVADPAYAEEFATSAGRKGCTTLSDPSRTIVTCRGAVLDAPSQTPSSVTTSSMGASSTMPPPQALRLEKIAATENGISTSSVQNPARYRPPWSYLTETSDPSTAWQSLRTTVRALPDVQVVTDTANYLHVTVPTRQPPLAASGLPTEAVLDDLEFVLRPDDQLVLYRSASRTAVFVYPLTQPVGDGQTNLQRLEGIRQTLGWSLLGDP